MEGGTMEEDMKKMLADTSFGDIVFLCGPNLEAVHACRLLVAARSPVLEAMLLKTQMAESKQSRIPLPEIDATTMRICLEFFYTDNVQEQSWLGPMSAMKVISAAKFFLVSKLEHLSISYLHSIPHIFQADETQLIKAYSYGARLHGAHHCALLHALLQKLADFVVYHDDEWDLRRLKGLSKQAMFHLVQTLCEYETKTYIVFYVIVQWCAAQIVLLSGNPQKEEKLVRNVIIEFLPWHEFEIDRHIATATNGSKHLLVKGSTSRILKLLAAQMANVLAKFPLDFSRIPAPILCSIIEPLDIVPPSMLMEAYRSQALSKPDFLRWDEFGHSENYAISTYDLTVISCQTHEFQGFARCNFGVNLINDQTVHWEMIILTPCESLRIGFFVSPPVKLSDGHVLGDLEGSCALASDGILHHNMGRGGKEESRLCERDCFDQLEGLRVGVLLDTDGFSFLINGKDIGDHWNMLWNINQMVYPAISMQKPGRAQVKMVIHNSMISPRRLNHGKRKRRKEV